MPLIGEYRCNAHHRTPKAECQRILRHRSTPTGVRDQSRMPFLLFILASLTPLFEILRIQ